MANPALLILAAGLGRRYGGLKQMDPVGPAGEVVLDYSVFDAVRAGFSKVVFVLHRDFEAVFRERVGRRFESRLEVRYVFQELARLPGDRPVPAGRAKPWGTGHAVWCAAGEIREPFAVINADDFYGADSFRQLGRFLTGVKDVTTTVAGCMIGFKLAHTLSEFGTVARGICQVDARGRLQSVEECTALERESRGARLTSADGSTRRFTGAEIVSLNCWGFSPAVFSPLERRLAAFLDERGRDLKAEFFLPSAVAAMISNGEATVDVLPTESAWFGITYREDHPRVVSALAALVRAGKYPRRLWVDGGSSSVHEHTSLPAAG